MLTTSSFTGPQDRDVVEEIVLVQGADEAPMYAALLAAGLGDEAGNEKVEWYTDAHSVRTTQIDNGGAAYTNATTTLVVDSSAPFYPGCLIQGDATNEIMLCVTVPDGTSITVRRGVGGVVAAHANSVANNAVLRCIGPAVGEGADALAFRNSNLTADFNYLQTFRKTVEISGRLANSDLLVTSQEAHQSMVKMEEILRDIENAILFGARDNDTTDSAGRKVTTMGGFWQHITTNVDNVGGTMSEDRLISGIEPVFRKGSKEKWCFHGELWGRTVHSIFKGRAQRVESDRAAGLQIDQIRFPNGGRLNLVASGTLSSFATGAAVIVDPRHAKLRPAKGDRGRLGWRPITVADGGDRTAKELFVEHTLEWGPESVHAIQKGVTGAA